MDKDDLYCEQRYLEAKYDPSNQTSISLEELEKELGEK